MKLKYTLAVVLCALAFSSASAADFVLQNYPSQYYIHYGSKQYENMYVTGSDVKFEMGASPGLVQCSGQIVLDDSTLDFSYTNSVSFQAKDVVLDGVSSELLLNDNGVINTTVDTVYFNSKVYSILSTRGSVVLNNLVANTQQSHRLFFGGELSYTGNVLGHYVDASSAGVSVPSFDVSFDIDTKLNLSSNFQQWAMKSLLVRNGFSLSLDATHLQGSLFVVETIDDISKELVKAEILRNFDEQGIVPLSADWVTNEYGLTSFQVTRTDLVVPEPSTATLGLVGLSALLLRRRRRQAA